MPYKVFKSEEGKFCLYKVDAEEKPVGDTLGCHATEKEAADQMAALYANEPEATEAKKPAAKGVVPSIREGRVLSTKNRELISAAISQSQEAVTALKALLNATEPEQRSAIVENLRSVRMIAEDADSITVGGYGVVWGGRDTYGTTFSPQTDLWTGRITAEPLVFYDHGMDGTLQKEVLGAVKEQKPDNIGLWVAAQLNRHIEYLAAIQQLIADGVLGWSSGAVGHLVDIDRDSGEVKSWPIVEYSLTPTPAEPRTLGVQELRSLAKFAPAVEALIPKAEGQAVKSANPSAGSVAAGETAPETNTSNEGVQQMPENTVNIEQIAKDAVDAAVKAYQAKLEAEPALMVGAFKTKPTAEVTQAAEDRKFLHMGEFLRSVQRFYVTGEEDPRLKPLRQLGLNEGVPADGGFLVQQDFANELVQKAYDIGEVTKLCKKYPIGAGFNGTRINYIAETSRVDGSRWGGITSYWLAEGGTKLPSHPTFGQMQLILKKVIALMYATDEELQDATLLAGLVNDVFPQELNFRVEDAIINGTGVGQPQGIMVSPSLVVVAIQPLQANTTIVFENVVNMWSRLWAPSRKSAVWLINQDIEPQLFAMNMAVGTGGVPVYMPAGGISGAPYATLFNRPVLASEHCATLGAVGDIILADFSQYALIDKGGIKSDMSIHVAFLTDESCFRWVYRVDGQSKWVSPLTPHSGSANTLSPFVVLAGRP